MKHFKRTRASSAPRRTTKRCQVGRDRIRAPDQGLSESLPAFKRRFPNFSFWLSAFLRASRRVLIRCALRVHWSPWGLGDLTLRRIQSRTSCNNKEGGKVCITLVLRKKPSSCANPKANRKFRVERVQLARNSVPNKGLTSLLAGLA